MDAAHPFEASAGPFQFLNWLYWQYFQPSAHKGTQGLKYRTLQIKVKVKSTLVQELRLCTDRTAN